MKSKLLILAIATWLLQISFGYSQSNHATNVSGSAAFQAEPLGWLSGTANDVEILNNFSSKNINLSTFNGSLIQRMTILSTGEVGIGLSSPGYRLDVSEDINAGGTSTTTANGYHLGTNKIIWHNGRISNLFVGVGAGNANATYVNCTFVGNLAGNANSYTTSIDGTENTFIGFSAGKNNSTGWYNTIIGSEAGLGTTTSTGSTFLGYRAGYTQSNGSYHNTFVGTKSGWLATNGAFNNSFYGEMSAGFNTLGSENTYIGAHSAYNNAEGIKNVFVGCLNQSTADQLGSLNTFIGYDVHSGTSVFQNSTGVGARVRVVGNNQMLLGGNSLNTEDNDVKVGIGLSGDNVGPGPQNSLEINADAANFMYTGVGSGLRFRQLTDANTPGINSGSGILSVDANGDVVYVEDIGNYCSESPQRPLHGDYEIALDNGTNGYDYHFTGQQDGNTDVIVGGGCSNGWPYAKFQSLQFTNQTSSANGESNGGLFYNSTANRFAIGGVGVSDQSEDNNFGLKGFAKLDAGKANYGVFGTTINFPVMLAGGMNVGVYGYSPWSAAHSGATLRFGVIGDLGIVSPCVPPPCPVTAPDYAGYFNGDVASTTGFWVVSDASLKENITDMNDAMSVISQLNPKAYEFKQEQNESMQLPRGTHYGFLSQEIESTLPQLVKESIHPAREDSTGNQTHAAINFKALNYMEIIPFLVGAIKEQQQSMEAMQAELASLSGGGNRNGHTGSEEENGGKDQEISNTINVELKNAKSIILNQNVPNPFAEQTTISYFLTDDVKKAQIFFYDNKGVILKIVDVNEKGTVQLNVYAADLSSGSYTYTLIADGKLIETKKMVKTN